MKWFHTRQAINILLSNFCKDSMLIRVKNKLNSSKV